MDSQQAYLAVVAFLNAHWEQNPVPGDFGDFCDMCDYVSGLGTRDPARMAKRVDAKDLKSTLQMLPCNDLAREIVSILC